MLPFFSALTSTACREKQDRQKNDFVQLGELRAGVRLAEQCLLPALSHSCLPQAVPEYSCELVEAKVCLELLTATIVVKLNLPFARISRSSRTSSAVRRRICLPDLPWDRFF